MAHKKSKKTRKSKNQKHNSKLNLLRLFLIIFLFAFLATIVSYFIMKNENSNKNVTNNILKSQTKEIKKIDPIKDFQDKKLDEYFNTIEQDIPQKDTYEEITEEFKKDYIEKHEVIKKEIIEPIKEIKKKIEPVQKDLKKEVIKENITKEVIKKVEPKIDNKKIITSRDTYQYNKTSKPKIAIVIDDVSANREKQKILNIGYKVNMAFLPPTKSHKNSAKIAQNLPFHIIHFPMQASSRFKGAEANTLNITDSYEKIEKRVKQLRQWYPKAKYTNNHTGSVFTQNEEAMDKLFKALKKYNFIFMDSRTTAKSVAKKMAKKYNMPYIVRNTFIDNKKDYSYIQNQLKKAIKIAKKRGYAIAIGHPYPITIKVLKESKHLLKGVDTIFINELPYLK